MYDCLMLLESTTIASLVLPLTYIFPNLKIESIDSMHGAVITFGLVQNFHSIVN